MKIKNLSLLIKIKPLRKTLLGSKIATSQSGIEVYKKNEKGIINFTSIKNNQLFKTVAIKKYKYSPEGQKSRIFLSNSKIFVMNFLEKTKNFISSNKETKILRDNKFNNFPAITSFNLENKKQTFKGKNIYKHTINVERELYHGKIDTLISKQFTHE